MDCFKAVCVKEVFFTSGALIEDFQFLGKIAPHYEQKCDIIRSKASQRCISE